MRRQFKVESYEVTEERSYPRYENNEPREYYSINVTCYRIVHIASGKIAKQGFSHLIDAEYELKTAYTLSGLKKSAAERAKILRNEIAAAKKALKANHARFAKNKKTLLDWNNTKGEQE